MELYKADDDEMKDKKQNKMRIRHIGKRIWDRSRKEDTEDMDNKNLA
jgi:hypothetical protein